MEVRTASRQTVKKAFLLNYEPRITARTTCTNLANMAQRAGKVANRHHLRLFATFDKLQSTFPMERKAVRFAPANAATADHADPADPPEQLKIKLEGIENAFGFIEHQQFLAGLRDPIRTEVIRASKATVTASKKYATELEAINMKDTLTLLTRGIASCQMEEFPVLSMSDMLPSVPADLFKDDELEEINVIRRRTSKLPFKKINYKRPNGNNCIVSCRYCKKKGHMQRECKLRLRNNAPMVHANGKPFTRNYVHAADTEEEGQTGIASIMLTKKRTGLNWF